MIVWLGDDRAHDPSTVGGKAASLSRIAARHRVPPGFVLTSRALAHGAADLARGVMPDDLRALIDEAYARMSAPRVAVRSSAIDEDGADHSFAGQYETYLNLEGADVVAAAVVRCFTSAFTDRAVEYRRQAGIDANRIGLAVLVQQLVPADVAAVVFSANPITGRLDEIVVNASYGLGESIVGGTTTPDTFVVDRDSLEIRSRAIGEKRRMTVSVPGGTREIETPALLRSALSVTDAQVVEMAELARALESTTGGPVDVECAWHAGILYLLQARPITTLRRNSNDRGDHS